jgi:hypothetical protein
VKYACIRACFFGGRLWAKGEIYNSPGGPTPPKWFVEVKGPTTAPRKVEPNEPKTFAELQRIEAEQMAKQEKPTPNKIEKIDVDEFLK